MNETTSTPEHRICQCELSGDVHVVTELLRCELCRWEDTHPFTPEQVGKAFDWLAARPPRASEHQGLTYVDDKRGALTLTFIAGKSEADVFDRFNEPVTWDGTYQLKVNPRDDGVYRIYLTRVDPVTGEYAPMTLIERRTLIKGTS